MFTFHACRECGDTVDDSDPDARLFCPKHPEAIVDSIMGGSMTPAERVDRAVTIAEGRDEDMLSALAKDMTPVDLTRAALWLLDQALTPPRDLNEVFRILDRSGDL